MFEGVLTVCEGADKCTRVQVCGAAFESVELLLNRQQQDKRKKAIRHVPIVSWNTLRTTIGTQERGSIAICESYG